MTTSTIKHTPENEPLIATGEQLQNLVEQLIELGVLVHDNQGTFQSHTALTNKVNEVVSLLSAITAAPFTQQYSIPVDVIQYIEEGRNPDIYTREFVEVNAKSNARIKGRMQGFAKLRDVLGTKLAQEFPRLTPTIKDIQERTSLQMED
ncbi:Mediator of RNA polymerase II transcription subunit 10 [Scheffersomyces spartinae]|uniref:Mediator of RNA polymerase II transcription subunit 10 n=1 Tax=Scheffersomyces spartinae TaxID=45513 RepID=A0A9P8AKA3_9ASCO|nr:Mediator of RNA polymerase II transcription subunit 10 [Scheffersomyces spartinae]KAG7196275.1 Mediator of RNA polymerase II transcription subunit 10 [Scheffersomyces spartinae]